ncbi:MAG TPA: hypothetical protein PLV59_00545 [Candidatus Dojkabacteria bacterium]|nr:hypothetical protein [Candidatus Dojkabacteria bacterium]
MRTGLINLSLITAITLSGCGTASKEGSPLQEHAMQAAQQTAEEAGVCPVGTSYNVQYASGLNGNSKTGPSPFDGRLRILMMNYDDSIFQHDASLHEVLHYCHDLYYSESYPTPIPTYKGKVVKALGFLQIYENGDYDPIIEEAYAYYMVPEIRDTWESGPESNYTIGNYNLARFMEAIVFDTNNINPSKMTLSQFMYAVFLKPMDTHPELLSEMTRIMHEVHDGVISIDDAMYYIYWLRGQ